MSNSSVSIRHRMRLFGPRVYTKNNDNWPTLHSWQVDTLVSSSVKHPTCFQLIRAFGMY